MARSTLTTGLLFTVLVSPALAENDLAAMPPPAERPYPYEILGLQPGDALEDVLAVYGQRSEAAPTSKSEVLRVQSPEGAVFEFTYQLNTTIGDIGYHGRVAKEPQDQVTATLASEVMEQRPMAIYRRVRQPSDQLPEPLALRAQIEQTYGAPSRVEVSRYEMILTYAWSTEGFIADLDAFEPLIDDKGTRYELCGSARHYENSVKYEFDYPRDTLIKPGCVATFTVRYKGEPGTTAISFSLVDYALGREHTAELDRQILNALSPDRVEASDMDL